LIIEDAKRRLVRYRMARCGQFRQVKARRLEDVTASEASELQALGWELRVSPILELPGKYETGADEPEEAMFELWETQKQHAQA
jgi:hypothetical protein